MLIRNTTYYMIASAISAIFGLLGAVVFTRALTPSEYGIYVVGVSTAGIVSAVLFTWVRLSVLRFQSEGGAVDIRVTSLVAYLISVCAAPLTIIAAALLGHFSMARTLGAVVFAVGLGLFELGQELLKARLQSFWFMIASILRSIAAFGLCLLAASLGGGGLGQLLMAALAYFVAAAIIGRVVWRRPLAPVNFEILKTFLRFGAPATISGLVYAVHAGTDRLFIAWLLGDAVSGLYGASADLVRQIILVPASSVAAASIPIAVAALARGGAAQAKPHLESCAELLLAVLVPCAVGLALTSSSLAALVLGPSFRQAAATLIPILAFAWLFQSITQSYFHISFHLAKKPHLGIVLSVGTLLVNVALVTPLVRRLGLPGAAASLVIAEAFGAALGFALTRYAHPLPLVPGAILRICLATAAMAAAVRAIQPVLPSEGLAPFAALIALGIATYLAAAYLLDIAGIRALARTLFNKRFAEASGAA
ncbi:MAG TPA: oligosaccharide flippase family protein [Roseiarcus sp.]|nr:oligosaccharide flippase family protein [Roseiarcus sp.]